MHITMNRLSIVGATFALLLLAACGEPLAAGGAVDDGTSEFSLLLTDAPATDAEWIRVNFGRIELVPADDSGEGIVVLTESAGTIDNVLDFQNGATTTLVDGFPIPDGSYAQIRLIVEEVEIGFDEDGTEVAYPVFVPSGAQTGLKIDIEPPLAVDAGLPSAVTLDFDAANAVIETPPGSGNYLLKPTGIRAVSAAGTLEGTVVEAGTAAPIENAIVDVYRDEDTEVLVSAATDATGLFRFITLTEGTYDLVVSLDGYGPVDVQDVVVDVDGTTVVDQVEMAPTETP